MSPIQPPLINGGPELPSPVFSPRPGWGGQLKDWFKDNAYLVVFRAVLLAAIALIVASLVKAPQPQTATILQVTPTPDMTGHMQTARPGEGLSHLAARALDEHLAKHPEHRLNGAQHLFSVDTLWRGVLAAQSRSPFVLRAGAQIHFPHEGIENVIARAKALTPRQQQAWAALIRK